MSDEALSAEALYQSLTEQGVELWCQGKMLRYRAPDGVLDDDAMARLRKHKKALIALIQSGANRADAGVNRQPTTVGQQAMTFMHMSAPYSPAYNVATAFRLLTPVSDNAITTAWKALVARHEMLRSTIAMHEGQLCREIHDQVELDIQFTDAASIDELALSTAVKTEYERPFDLAKGPLLRIRVFNVSTEHRVFLVALHHVIFDAWSLWILQDEFFKLLNGSPASDLPSLTGSFSDFVEEQATVHETPQGREDLRYWHDQLAGSPPAAPLPYDRTPSRRTTGPRRQGETFHFAFDRDDAEAIRNCAKNARVTPFVWTLAVFNVLLHRLSGRTDLVVGTTTSGRTRSDWTQTIGYFVNTLPIRTLIDGDPSFADYAATVKTGVLEALSHQSVPFATIMDRMPGRDAAAQTPLFNVMFGLHKPRFAEVADVVGGGMDSVTIGDLKVAAFALDQQEGQCDLTMELFDTADGFIGDLKYDAELFDVETVANLASQYQTLMRSILKSPDERVSRLSIASPGQLDQVKRWSCGDAAPDWDDQMVHQWVANHAAERGDTVAWIADDQTWSYRELDQAANGVAKRLLDRGVQSGDVLACLNDRRPETAALVLGIWKVGGAIMPLDADSPGHRNAEMIHAAGADRVIASPDMTAWQVISDEIDRRIVLNLDSLTESLNPWGAGTESNQPAAYVDVDCDQPAYILHTSGSTGRPKGVVVSHRSLAKHAIAINESYRLRQDDRVLQFSHLTFDPSLEQMVVPWMVGASVVMRGNSLWTHETLAQQIERHQITMLNVPPSYFEQCSSRPLHEAVVDGGPLSSLRLIILGGDIFPTDSTLHGWRQRGVRLINAYGPTETVITATTHEVNLDRLHRARMPIGRPRAGSRVYVLDRQGCFCPPGVAGRLLIAGDVMSDGYRHDESMNDRVFVPDAFAESFGDHAPNPRMYETGDWAYWNHDGELEFLGRGDEQIKIDGIRTDTSEIRRVINAIDGITQSYVGFYPAKQSCHVEDASRDEQTRRLVAWITCDPSSANHRSQSGPEVWQDSIVSTLRGQLPRHMIPRQVIVVDSLPMTASGKVHQASLPSPPPLDTRVIQSEYAAPRNSWESTLAKIWSDELGVTPVGIHDNFFDLGGASLSSLRIIAKANDAGLANHLRSGDTTESLQPEMLFEHQTIAELHDVLHQQVAVATPSPTSSSIPSAASPDGHHA
ncbi:MAG: amino acid adenylation domain-containing protein [Planctomycetota bacterium]